MKPPNTKPLTRRELLEIRRELHWLREDVEESDIGLACGLPPSAELKRLRRLTRRLDALLQRRVG